MTETELECRICGFCTRDAVDMIDHLSWDKDMIEDERCKKKIIDVREIEEK